MLAFVFFWRWDYGCLSSSRQQVRRHCTACFATVNVNAVVYRWSKVADSVLRALIALYSWKSNQLINKSDAFRLSISEGELAELVGFRLSTVNDASELRYRTDHTYIAESTDYSPPPKQVESDDQMAWRQYSVTRVVLACCRCLSI